MTALEATIRELVVAIVREEIARALADVRRPDDYLSTAAAAKFAGVATGTIRRWIREGRLADHRAGRVVRVRRADLERLLRGARRRKASPEELAMRAYG